MGLLGLARYCCDSVLGGLEHWLGEVLDGPMYLNIKELVSKNEAWRGSGFYRFFRVLGGWKG